MDGIGVVVVVVVVGWVTTTSRRWRDERIDDWE
jgi:hypothetical protein